MSRRALITGIGGQDGSYLAEYLAAKDYEIHGTIRPEIAKRPDLMPDYLRAIASRITFHPCDLTKPGDVAAAFQTSMPDECYHLGGPSTVDSNVSGSAAVFATILESTRALLDAMREHPGTSLFFAGTSEIFGAATYSPQDETSPPRPRSIYGLAKLAAWDLIVRERRNHNVFACVGLLYNHESVRRPVSFLPRKVAQSVARIAAGRQDHLILGNLDAQRDWGYAPDFVDAMWRILQAPEPADYVIATGACHSVRDLVRIACAEMNIDPDRHIRVDPALIRPAEVVTLRGDYTRLREATGWRPRQSFEGMIREMVRFDYSRETGLGMPGPKSVP